MPQVTLPSAGTRLVHAQKPIAITTPQPHNSSVNTSKQSDTSTNAENQTESRLHSRSTHIPVPSQSHQRESAHPDFNSQNLPFSSSGYILNRPGSGHSLPRPGSGYSIPRPGSGHSMPTSFSAAIDNAVERYVIRRPDGDNNLQNTNNSLAGMDSQLGFACPTCPKVFKSKAAMKLHMTVHKTSEERQFVCQVCQRRFLHRHHLVVHQRKHSGEKPYVCNACGKSFMAVFLLHKHLRKHLREQGQSTQISNEQLKQLHGRKRSPSRSEGGEESYPRDGIKHENPDLVIVSDDEDAAGNAGASAEDKCRSEEQNVICLDGSDRNETAYSTVLANIRQQSETFTEPGSKPERNTDEKNGNNTNVEITNIEIKSNTVKILASSVKEKDGSGVKTKLVIKEIEYDTSFNPDRKDDSTDPKTKLTLSTSDHSYHNNNKEESGHFTSETIGQKTQNQKQYMLNAETPSDALGITDPVDPWPKYTSEDEVELDCLTGEMKIINRAAASPEISERKKENCDSNSEKPHSEIKALEVVKENIYDRMSVNVSSNTQRSYQSEHTDFDVEMKDERISEKGEAEYDVFESNMVKRLKVEEIEEKKEGVVCNVPAVTYEPSKHSDKLSHRRCKVRIYKGRRKIKRFKCETCFRTFYSQHHLLLHMNTHKKNPALDSLKKAKANQINVAFAQKLGFSCSVCSKHFKMQKGLNSHMRIHSSKLAENKLIRRRFRDFLMADTTNKCSKTQNLSPSIKIESQLKNDSEGKAENDETLGNTSLMENDSINSSDITSVNEEFVLSEKTNLNPQNIEESIQVIMDKNRTKRYVCHACNNTYTTKQKLKMHALIHKDNCYLCDMCGKSFFRAATLEKHVSTHMLPRPHVCNVCKKSFIHRSSLMRHRSVHEKSSTPALKQQPPDVKFELEMLDTYAMLRKERMEKLQKEKMGELKIEAPASDVIDLSVPRRNELTPQKLEENLQPPKLSPMLTQFSVPCSNTSVVNLSPPNITKERVQDDQSDIKAIKNENEMPVITNENEVAMITETKRPRSARSTYRKKIEPQNGPEEEPRVRQKRRKTRVYPTSCRICKEVFPNVIGLKTHMSVHNSVETHLYECNVCGHRFTQSCSLLRHLKTSCGDGNPKENKLQCGTCEKVFQRKNAYDRHMDSHIHGEPPRLSINLYDKHSDENEHGRLFESNVGLESLALAIKQEVKTEVQDESVHTRNNIQHDDQVDNAELSEAETIPYGKTSSDESNDGFSDSSETESDQEQSRPQSQQTSNTSLNLLSEVCSSLINFEKEAEIKKQNELISVQKELETIDILARLSRQNASQRIKSESETFDPRNMISSNVNTSTKEHDYSTGQLACNVIPKSEPVEYGEIKSEFYHDNKVKEMKSAKIPTVVTDIESEAEKRRKSYFIKMQQRILEGTPRSQPGLTPPTSAGAQQKPTLRPNSLLAAALFDKGKPDPVPLYKPSFIPSSSAISNDMMPTDLSMKKKTVHITPLNLSPRESPNLRKSLLSTSSVTAVPQPPPPPLVPVFKCPNCGRLLYNKTDYRQHMRGHGISPPDSPPQFAQIPQPSLPTIPSRPPEVVSSRDTPTGTIDFSKEDIKSTGKN